MFVDADESIVVVSQRLVGVLVLLVLTREAALADDGQEGGLASEEDEWDVAEEDHQEEESQQDRVNSIFELDILKNGRLNI